MHTAAPEDKEINKMHREISNDTLNHQNYTMMVCNTNEISPAINDSNRK